MVSRSADLGRPGYISGAFRATHRWLSRGVTTDAWFALFGATLVVVIGASLAIALNVWIDEAFTLHTTGAGPMYDWRQTIAFEGQPALYFVLEAIWRTMSGTSIAFARVPSILFAASAVAVTITAIRRVAPRINPLTVILLRRTLGRRRLSCFRPNWSFR
jgi:hypothetical protein